MSENLNLDSKLLQPMKESLENAINILTKSAILTGKDAEISLKINISTYLRNEKDRKWLEPRYEYQVNEKIKEPKSSYKNDLGYNYKIELEDDNILVQNMNEQTSLFGKDD